MGRCTSVLRWNPAFTASHRLFKLVSVAVLKSSNPASRAPLKKGFGM